MSDETQVILRPVRRFSASDLGQHIRQHHPNCPKTVRKALIRRIVAKPWVNANMGTAVGITIENYLRHEVSGYDNLLRLGIERDQARTLIRPQIDLILAIWKRSRELSGASRHGELKT